MTMASAYDRVALMFSPTSFCMTAELTQVMVPRVPVTLPWCVRLSSWAKA